MAENPLSKSEPWTLVATGYQAETVPVFRQYCSRALELVDFKPGKRVLDVACGPGTLTFMVADKAERVSAIDFAEGMLEICRAEALKQGAHNIQIEKMDGQKLAYADATFDYAFSMFGLMFFPDRSAGFSELYRVLRPGGRAAVSSWAPVSDSPLMALMFNALRAAFPERPEPKTNMLSLENPELFAAEMQQAGFQNVQVTAFDGHWQIESHDSFLESMVAGSAPFQLMIRSLGETAWAEKKTVIRGYLKENLPALPATLSSRAFIGTGAKIA